MHYNVGNEVRTAIGKIGGAMLEDLLKPEKSIQEIERADGEIEGENVNKTNSGQAKRISLLDCEGMVQKEFISISEATRETGISTHHIKDELAKGNSNLFYVGARI